MLSMQKNHIYFRLSLWCGSYGLCQGKQLGFTLRLEGKNSNHFNVVFTRLEKQLNFPRIRCI